MPYTVTVTLRRNETGKVRKVEAYSLPDDMVAKWPWSDESVEEAVRNTTAFSWLENNYSCDCNRHGVFFQDDEEWPDGVEEECDCGEGKYDLLELLVNGKSVELYRTPHTEKEA